jgi:predicted dehydrogenase
MAIRTAIIGYGRSGSSLHADPIEALPEFELVAVCDIDPSARAKAEARFRCRTYEDYKVMLSAETLDLVVIVTRSHQHCGMTCDCLAAGVNVLVTKPWALDAGEALRMIVASKESGKLLLPWLPSRWGGDLVRLKELVASGVIGKVFQIRRSEFNLGTRADWQTERRFGGGYLLNWGPHLVDQPLQLAGSPVRSVFGELKQIKNPGDVEDVFFAVLRTENAITVISEYNVGARGFPNWVVQGDKGTITVRETEIEIFCAQPVAPPDPQAFGTSPVVVATKDDSGSVTQVNRYGDAMEIYPCIARAVRGESPYAIPTESALELTRVLDAIRTSSETGSVVRL